VSTETLEGVGADAAAGIPGQQSCHPSQEGRLEPIRYMSGQRPRIAQLEALLKNTGTTAFLIIRDDVILYERYFRGYDRVSFNTSASVSNMVPGQQESLVGLSNRRWIERLFCPRDPGTVYLHKPVESLDYRPHGRGLGCG